MKHITAQMLKYEARDEEIATVCRILDLMREKRFDEASRALTVFLHFLQDAQTPKVVDYDPRLEQIRMEQR